MRIPAEVIIEALSPFQPELHLSSGLMEFTKVRPIRNQALEPGALYIGLAEEISTYHTGMNTAAISIGKPAITPDELIVLPDNCNLLEVFICLQNIFDSFSNYEIELLKTLDSGTYQDLMNVCYPLINNPTFFIDSSYRMHALAPDIELTNYREWQHMRRYGFVSFDTIKAMKASGEFDVVRAFQGAAIHFSSVFQRSCITRNLKLNSNFAGRIVTLDANRPFTQRDLLVSNILAEIIEVKMTRDEAFQHIHGREPLDRMLHDLASGIRLDEQLIKDRLQYLPEWKRGYFRVLAVPLGSSDDQTFDYYASLLEKNSGMYSILFENTLTTILHYRSKGDYYAVHSIIAGFLSDNSLKGGLSNEFSNLSDLCGYYRQAVISLELSKNERQLNFYSEYTLAHILSFFKNENIPLLCHPSLIFLKQFDDDNGTPFFNTLLAYLENERSLVKTAQVLYIHRNTLVYRMEKINSLLKLDLDNPDLRLHLLFSYRLLTGNE